MTGGASGIGRALGEALVAAGAEVILADVDEAKLGDAAASMGAEGRVVDVTDAAAVEALVEHAFAAHGRLDYLFNNAGIALFGEVRDMSLEQWERLIAVNINGVANGVHAAYPRMVAQGSGHIVNTASMAGLVPSPGATAYAMTKHAVVGLSTGLRGEGARFGVKVSVVCPGLIDTPLKDNLTWLNLDKQKVIDHPLTVLHSPESCAQVTLEGVRRNKAIITVTPMARTAWWGFRALPGVATWFGGVGMNLTRKRFGLPPDP